MKKIIALVLMIFSVSSLIACKDTKPVEPTEPVEPTTPVIPTEPVESTAPVNPTTPIDPTNPVYNGYSVRVLYPNGDPVTSGVKVQWCHSLCLPEVLVDENGYAYNNLDDNIPLYYVHLKNLPEGYTYNPNNVTNSQNKQIEIKLLNLNEATSGNGSEQSPFVITTGAYVLKVAEAETLVYYSFTALEDGKYTFESFADISDASVDTFDPSIFDMGTEDFDDNSGSGRINFKYSFNAKANTTYIFAMMVMDSSGFSLFPAEITFTLVKNA